MEITLNPRPPIPVRLLPAPGLGSTLATTSCRSGDSFHPPAPLPPPGPCPACRLWQLGRYSKKNHINHLNAWFFYAPADFGSSAGDGGAAMEHVQPAVLRAAQALAGGVRVRVRVCACGCNLCVGWRWWQGYQGRVRQCRPARLPMVPLPLLATDTACAADMANPAPAAAPAPAPAASAAGGIPDEPGIDFSPLVGPLGAGFVWMPPRDADPQLFTGVGAVAGGGSGSGAAGCGFADGHQAFGHSAQSPTAGSSGSDQVIAPRSGSDDRQA